MSVLAVNAITNASGGSTATINGMTPTADSLQGFRNRIINGDMRIDQRNAGASVTPTTGAYTLDRWAVEMSQASKFSIQQSSTAPTGFTNSMIVTSLSAYTVGASEYFVIGQCIEGFNIADLGFGTASAKTITLSFWVRSSLTGTFGGSVLNNAAGRNYVFSYTINAADTWEQKTITIAGDTSGTWLTTNGAGLFVRFCIGAGSSVTTSAGSWSATANRSVTGQTSVVGTNGATFYITGVQLEVGSVATPFERRPYGTELSLCLRYYETGYFVTMATPGTSGVYLTVYYKAKKRANPTVTTSRGVTAGNATVDAFYQNSNDTGSDISTFTSSAEL